MRLGVICLQVWALDILLFMALENKNHEDFGWKRKKESKKSHWCFQKERDKGTQVNHRPIDAPPKGDSGL